MAMHSNAMRAAQIALLVLLLPCVASLCSSWYNVKAGDTCYDILKREKLEDALLKKLNPGLDCDKLQVGDALCLADTSEKLPCAEQYSVAAGDYCYQIWTTHRLSERQFRELNTDLNCDTLEVGQKLCVIGDWGSSGPAAQHGGGGKYETLKTQPPCGEQYVAKEGDTCDQIANSFETTKDEMDKLNVFINCSTALKAGDRLCVLEESNCQIRHQIAAGDTCFSLKTAYRLTEQQLSSLNDDKLDCDLLEIGKRICIWSIYWRQVPNMDCEQRHTVSKGDTCWSISTGNSISVDELMFLNPRLNCSNLQETDNICVQGKHSAKCAKLASISATDTCESIEEQSGLSLEVLMRLNPTMDCDQLNRTAQVCVGTGYFEAGNCLSSIRIPDATTVCGNLSDLAGVPLESIRKLNPYLDCEKPLNASSLVCTESLGGLATGVARGKVVDAIRSLAPEIASAYQDYLSKPDYRNSAKLNDLMQNAILKSEVNDLMKQLYKTDVDMKNILEAGYHVERQEVCAQMKDLEYSKEVKDCFCDDEELMITCRVRASKEMMAGLNEEDQLVSRRRKREKKKQEYVCTIGCGLSFPGKTPDKDDEPTTPGKKVLDYYNTCFGGGCCFPLGLFELAVESDICVGPLQIIGKMIQFCKKDEETCKAEDGDTVQGLQVLIDRTSSARIKLCLIGSSVLKKLAKYEVGLCLTIAAMEYAAFVGRMTVHAELQAIIIKIKGGVQLKVHDLPFENICEHKKFECEDFCLWKFNNDPPGQHYGFLKITAFEIFGLDGITLVDEKFNNPSKAGCDAGNKAAIIMLNQRKCKNPEDNKIKRRCFSGDDTIDWELLGPENGFDFKPLITGRTTYACEFVDMNEQKIGFEAYGSKSNKGKKNFYYAVRNDGVYFSEDKDKFEILKGKWDKPCEGEDIVEDNSGSIEPTGTSSVPAASCGKRIIGYYTGWGEREISEDQLKKVTHVIFAFVATQADGSIGFGAVSNDDSSEDAGKKAESRFNDLRKKVRGVNAGVKMMFAVGGWDNSQHFSAIAADDGKRQKFVDSVADFLKKHTIDGVDVDWEYPVTGGAHEGIPADKGNYVTLLRDLRSRLTNLQQETGRKSEYEISLASAAGEWTIRPGYDLSGILQYANFVNVMTYDYYGAWEGKWGAYTGPPAPLYYGSPKGFSGKLNADFSMKYYACRSKKPSQLNMGVPFYGRFWNNVGDSIDGKDDMWRTASAVNGKFDGGFVGWRNIQKEGWNVGSATFHDKVKSPYIFDAGRRKFLGFENERSLNEKKDYAIQNNLGGLMIWALDQDDDSDTLLNIVSSADLCSGGSGDTVKHKCVPIDDVRWWNPENGGEAKQGMCGKSAPLIDGFYPVCDPDDPGYACCGKAGYCGSEAEFCECDGCADYRKNPDLIIKEPIRPTQDVQWYLMDAPDGQRGRCGKGIPLLNGKEPICNGDDPTKHCCSNGGYCGSGKEFCECDGCIDYARK